MYVGDRSCSKRVQARGTFAGAKVVRGASCTWIHQPGAFYLIYVFWPFEKGYLYLGITGKNLSLMETNQKYLPEYNLLIVAFILFNIHQ